LKRNPRGRIWMFIREPDCGPTKDSTEPRYCYCQNVSYGQVSDDAAMLTADDRMRGMLNL
jgi:hypothetical protein